MPFPILMILFGIVVLLAAELLLNLLVKDPMVSWGCGEERSDSGVGSVSLAARMPELVWERLHPMESQHCVNAMAVLRPPPPAWTDFFLYLFSQ